jgi:hypothetical protein
MSLDEFNDELVKLGLVGPMGERRLCDGSFILIYKYRPDGSHKRVPPGSSLTPDQRRTTITELHRHLCAVENNRNPEPSEQ